jgi:hypothetical protein
MSASLIRLDEVLEVEAQILAGAKLTSRPLTGPNGFASSGAQDERLRHDQYRPSKVLLMKIAT